MCVCVCAPAYVTDPLTASACTSRFTQMGSAAPKRPRPQFDADTLCQGFWFPTTSYLNMTYDARVLMDDVRNGKTFAIEKATEVFTLQTLLPIFCYPNASRS